MMRLGSSDSTRHIGARYDVHFCYTYPHEYETKLTRTKKTHHILNLETAQRVVSTEPRPRRLQRRRNKTSKLTHMVRTTLLRIAIASRVERDRNNPKSKSRSATTRPTTDARFPRTRPL